MENGSLGLMILKISSSCEMTILHIYAHDCTYIGVCTASFILCNFPEGKVYVSLLHTFYIVMEAVAIVVS